MLVSRKPLTLQPARHQDGPTPNAQVWFYFLPYRISSITLSNFCPFRSIISPRNADLEALIYELDNEISSAFVPTYSSVLGNLMKSLENIGQMRKFGFFTVYECFC